MPVDEEAIFHAARALPTGEVQHAFVAQACGGNDALLRRVQALLQIYRASVATSDTLVSDLLDTKNRDLKRPEFPQIESYEILEQIGEGGFGYVFRAQQTRPLRRKVAIKLLKPGMDSREVLARFEAERQALAVMSHAGIAGVFDAGTTTDGRPYFVMELVEGRPITDYCDQARLSLKQRLELFATVCQAVQHAHQRGIIHRDLKPGNVLIAQHDDKAIAKVIDFGIAKAISQPLGEQSIHTRAMQLIGTPLYMSPEQAEAGALDIDTRSDVYSLGVLLYELLTGATPFDKEMLRAAGDFGMRKIIREEEPPAPSQKVSSLSGERLSQASRQRGLVDRRLSQTLRGELDWIVMKALEKDPNRRYESASSFAADIERYLNHEPIEASPPSSSYRLRKYLRRNQVLLGATTVIALALLTGTCVSLWQAYEANLARKVAEDERKKANASYQKARETVKTLLAEVAAKDVAVIPGMRELYVKLLDEASDSYDALIRIMPDDPDIYADSGELHRIRGKLDLAQSALQQAVHLEPENARYHEALARILAMQSPESDAYERGLLHATRALDLQEESIPCRLLRAILNARLDRAEEAYRELEDVERKPKLTSDDYVAMVKACRYLEDPHKGKEYAEKAVQLDPLNDVAWMELAGCFRHTHEYEKAIEAFTESLRLDRRVNMTDRNQKLEWRGDCYLQKGMYAEAAADFREYGAADPSAVHTFKLCASCAFVLEDYQGALADLRRGYELNPSDKSLLTWISPSRTVRCPSSEFVSGVFDLASDSPIELAALHSARADYSIQLADDAGAYRDLIRASELNPNDFELGKSAAVKALVRRGSPYAERLSPLVQKFEAFLRSEAARLSAILKDQAETLGLRNRKTRSSLRALLGVRTQEVSWHTEKGDIAAAFEVADELATLARVYTPGNARMDPACEHVGYAWWELGDNASGRREYDEAMKAYAKALELFERLAKDYPERKHYHGQIAITWNGFSHVYEYLGRFEESEAAVRHALDHIHPFPHEPACHRPEVMSQGKLLLLLVKMNRLNEAAKAGDDLVKLFERHAAKNGPMYHDWQHAAHNWWVVGDLQLDNGNHLAAEHAYEQAIAIFARLAKVSVDYFHRREHSVALGKLATLRGRQNRWREAEELSEQSLSVIENLVAEVPGETSHQPAFTSALNRAAEASSRAGNSELAAKMSLRLEAAARAHVETCRSAHGDKGRQTLSAQESLAVLLEAQGKYVEVESIASSLLEAWKEQGAPHQIAVCNSLIGVCHLARGESERAESLLLDAFQGINTTRMPGYRVADDLSAVALRLVRLYETKNDWEQIVRWNYEAEWARQIVVKSKPKASPVPSPEVSPVSQ